MSYSRKSNYFFKIKLYYREVNENLALSMPWAGYETAINFSSLKSLDPF